MDLSILIVTYGNPELTAACLESVYAETEDVAFEVVLVDNLPGDGTAEMLAERFPQVRRLSPRENLGFARGNNLAAREARGTHLVLLNPDTVVHDRALTRLLAFGADRSTPVLAGGRTLRPDGTLDPSSCWGLPSLWSTACFATGLSTLRPRSRWLAPESLGRWERDSVREVDSISGCLLLVRADVWRQLGGFDERYWVYGEDLDLCTRARALGWHPVITPSATVVHAVGASSSSEGKTVLVTAGRLTWVLTHWRGPRRRAGVWLTRLAVGGRAALAPLTGRGGKWRAAWRRRDEWWDGFPPLPTAPEQPRPAAARLVTARPAAARPAEPPCT